VCPRSVSLFLSPDSFRPPEDLENQLSGELRWTHPPEICVQKGVGRVTDVRSPRFLRVPSGVGRECMFVRTGCSLRCTPSEAAAAAMLIIFNGGSTTTDDQKVLAIPVVGNSYYTAEPQLAEKTTKLARNWKTARS